MDGGRRGAHRGVVDQRRHQVSTLAHGYRAPLGTLIAGLLALIVFDLAHRPAAPALPHASTRPTVTVTASPHASTVGQAPAGRGAQPTATGSSGLGAARGAGSVIPARSGTGPTPSSTQSAPTPAPSPGPTRTPRPPVSITAAIVVPLRGATPIPVRATVVIPAAPPFPDVLLNAGLNLTLG